MPGEELVLKILTGPHAGAEISLKDGDYVLGASDDCDFALADSALAEHHMSISICDGVCSVSPMDGVVMLNGEQISQETTIPPFIPLVVGGTTLCLGPEDEPWPQIPLGELISPPTKQDEPQPVDTSDETASQDVASSIPATSVDLSPSEDSTSIDDNDASPFDQSFGIDRFRRFVSKPTGAIVLGIATVLFVFIILFSLRLLSTSTEMEHVRETSRLLHNAGFTGLRVTEGGDGEILVKGRVADDKSLVLLRKIVDSSRYPLHLDVDTAKESAEKLEHWLNAKSTPLHVEAARSGTVKVLGFAATMDVLEKLLNEAQRELDDLGSIETNIATYEQVGPELDSLLASEGLEGMVKVEVEDFFINVETAFGRELEPAWMRVRQALDEMYPFQVPLRVKHVKVERARDETQEALEAAENAEGTKDEGKGFFSVESWKTVRSVSLTTIPMAYIDGAGQFHELGSLLPNGFRVSEVTPNGVVLIKQDNMIFLPVGRGQTW
ncbi:type III secretion system inner membrane ring subunit SctD [Desulfovibrio inopinatus]|uniref:type III secretion system inner membrane ring subunit SctD n=1 Tax=Desulfovibrio inopinatus TaxID=102109 RepID=UPI000426D23C|nr:type III secretion system inner membrane ring subunit SctD [Desulfovibrio inopinatus]